MRHIETPAVAGWDADPVLARLVKTDLHAGEAMAVAVNLRNALIQRAAANRAAEPHAKAA